MVERLILEVVAGPRRGTRFTLDRGQTFLVGRADEVHLCLADDPRVSRHHYLIEANGAECYLRDLDSTNGTFVNGVRVKEALLQPDDVIASGATQVALRLDRRVEDTEAWNASPPLGAAPESHSSESVAPLPLVPGYTIRRVLGRGGMGIVYLATQLATGRDVALKVVLPASKVDEHDMRRFLRETAILGQLIHKRIVRFYEMDMLGGQFFFVMEYVKTIDLKRRLADRTEPSRVRLACGIACQTLEGLHYAHQQGVVHRDVKPSNILVFRRDGGALSAKLADFGLAKNYQSAGFSGLTRDGQAVGTLQYMAPEQLLDARYVKPAADIYSVGATLYQFLSGRPLFDMKTRRDLLLMILEDEPVPLLERAPGLPPELAKIVHQAISKDAHKRFPTAQAMWNALAPYARE
jgi:serine/threonine-protein kinase